MKINIQFEIYEINALNKLLGFVKFEENLSAEDLNHFASSPYIISVIKKIHWEYRQAFSHDSPQALNQDFSFRLSNSHGISDLVKRISLFGNETKVHLAALTSQEIEEYCDLLFAPFIPTPEQRKTVISALESLQL